MPDLVINKLFVSKVSSNAPMMAISSSVLICQAVLEAFSSHSLYLPRYLEHRKISHGKIDIKPQDRDSVCE
jgi:hypothetical protein